MLQKNHVERAVKRYSSAFRRILPLAVLDAVILLVAYMLTYSIRTNSLLFDSQFTTSIVGLAIIVTLGALYAFGAYNRIWSRTSGHEVVVILKGALAGFILVLLLDLSLHPRHLPLSVIGVSHMLALTGFVAVRYRSRLISAADWRWRAVWHHEFPTTKTRVLIVGAGEAGQITALRLKRRYQDGNNGHQVVGFVDDDPSKQHMFVEGAPVLGDCAAIPEITAAQHIELIVFAIHNITGTRFREILTICEQTTARIKIVPDVFELLNTDDHAPLLRDVQAEDLLGRQPISWHSGVDAALVSNKTVLITGAAGSIGSELCRQMMKYHPVRLVMVDNNESGLHDLHVDLQNEHPDQDIVAVLADITNRAKVEAIFARYQPQLVYHAAAYKHVPLLETFPDEAIRVNVGGTLNVAEIAQAQGVERFILISTDKAVNPSSIMGASKRICELVTQALSTQSHNRTLFAAVRFGNVLGSRGSVVPTFERQIEAGGPVTVTDKDMVRYFMSIPEAVNLVIQAACLTDGDDLFMLRMGEAVPIVELAERMIRLHGLRPQIDIPIVFTGARPGEKLCEELYADFETPYATVHPDIVRLNGVIFHWTPQEFIARVHDMLDSEAHDPERMLDTLRQLASDAVPELTLQSHTA